MNVNGLKWREFHEIALALLKAFGLPGLDSTLGKGLALIRDDQTPVDSDDATKAAASFAGADRRVKREMAWRYACEAMITSGASLLAAPVPGL